MDLDKFNDELDNLEAGYNNTTWNDDGNLSFKDYCMIYYSKKQVETLEGIETRLNELDM